MATSIFIYLSISAVLEKQNNCADSLGICKLSGRNFFPNAIDKQTVSLQTLVFFLFLGEHDHSVFI